ncbi:MAG: cysteine desulfurase family protein [bacterium]|nr:cysteine desulfurase family protein [bacterium]
MLIRNPSTLLRVKRLYADAAAATPLSKRTREELVRLLSTYGNPGALHSEGVGARKELESARAAIAAAIAAHPDEIVFVASGTEANNLAIAGTIRPLLQASQTALHAITCAIEHQSVLEPLRALQREGLEVTELEVDREGLVDPKKLAAAITDTTVFVSIQMVNSEVGTIEPIREIAKEIRRVRQNRIAPASALRAARPSLTSASSDTILPLFFHTDASQAPLWLPLVVEKLGIDLMTLDGQKVLGPKGVGALYIKRGTPVEPILHGGKQEFGLRGGTENTPLAGAFAVALQDAQRGVEARAKKVAAVRDFLIAEIKKLLPDAIINGPAAYSEKKGTLEASVRLGLAPRSARAGEFLFSRVANNVSVSIPGLDGEMATIAMDARGIAVSTRSACNIGDEEPSHVIVALLRSDLRSGLPRSDLWRGRSAIRITLLPDATRADASRIARTLFEVAQKYRQS